MLNKLLKKQREMSRNRKKGFTLVELIVVIVIILVLAGALVPVLIHYIGDAGKASVKADAATMLAQIQADYAGAQAGLVDKEPEGVINGVTVVKSATDNKPVDKPSGGPVANYFVSDKKEITYFSYATKDHTVVWDIDEVGGEGKGWTMDPTPTT